MLSAKRPGRLLVGENTLMSGALDSHFCEPIIPAGSSVECFPISAKEQPEKQVLSGTFFGYVLYGGSI